MQIKLPLTNKKGHKQLVWNAGSYYRWSVYNRNQELTMVASRNLTDCIKSLYSDKYLKLAELMAMFAFFAPVIIMLGY